MSKPRVRYFLMPRDRIMFFAQQKVRVAEGEFDGYYPAQSYGSIPQRLIPEGVEAIRAFAENRAAEGLKEARVNAAEKLRRMHNLNFPLTVKHRGRTLKGVLVGVYGSDLDDMQVMMKRPFRIEGHCHWRDIFYPLFNPVDNKGRLRPEVLKKAREELIFCYRSEVRARKLKGEKAEPDANIKALVQKLNRASGWRR